MRVSTIRQESIVEFLLQLTQYSWRENKQSHIFQFLSSNTTQCMIHKP